MPLNNLRLSLLIRTGFTFYRSFCVATGAITICCSSTRQEIEAYIDEKKYNDTYYFFKAIARHESPRGQFYKTGDSRDGNPVFGGPDGWGIMQIDTQRDSTPDLSHLWNWKKNVDKGFNVLKEKVKETLYLLNEQIKKIKKPLRNIQRIYSLPMM